MYSSLFPFIFLCTVLCILGIHYLFLNLSNWSAFLNVQIQGERELFAEHSAHSCPEYNVNKLTILFTYTKII